MITPVLVDYEPNDFDMHPIDQWAPTHGEPIDFWMTITVGPDSDSGHQFQLRVASPEAALAEGAISCRHLVLVEQDAYSFGDVVQAILAVLRQCERPSFEEASVALSRYFLWEYEGHKFVDDDGSD